MLHSCTVVLMVVRLQCVLKKVFDDEAEAETEELLLEKNWSQEGNLLDYLGATRSSRTTSRLHRPVKGDWFDLIQWTIMCVRGPVHHFPPHCQVFSCGLSLFLSDCSSSWLI